MSYILLTPYKGSILGPIAKLLGWIMNGIYVAMNQVFGVESVALSIILLTILIYLCLLPLTIKQQKYSKLSQQMQPEIQAIQAKYKGKKDQASMTAMQQETQEVYDKYGVSATGSCVQLLIQMPILLSLWRVFSNIPAYVTPVKNKFTALVTGILGEENFGETLTTLMKEFKITGIKTDFTVSGKEELQNYVIDVLNRLPGKSWSALGEKNYFPNLQEAVESTRKSLESAYSLFGFKGISISETPWNVMSDNVKGGSFLLLFVAFMIPVLSYITQVINIKLMPQAGKNDEQMARQMKTMNTFMPLVSFFMCFTVPIGLGIYWIAGAVVRGVQQIFVNRHIQNLNLDEIIEKNKEKAKKKQEKRGIYENQIRNAASINTRSLSSKAASSADSSSEKEEALEKAMEAGKKAKPGSMTARANMVKEFNEMNSKK